MKKSLLALCVGLALAGSATAQQRMYLPQQQFIQPYAGTTQIQPRAQYYNPQPMYRPPAQQWYQPPVQQPRYLPQQQYITPYAGATQMYPPRVQLYNPPQIRYFYSR